LLAPAEFRLLPQWGLGLTDVNKTESGRDAALSRDAFDPDALRAKIETYQPRFLATTGKASGRHVLGRPCDYGLQPETIGATRIFVLPSTSGAARGHWSIEPWRALANAART
jgi:TDG/mug DNA glycosylase family protein